jgi:SAM-dependent methyltransferase
MTINEAKFHTFMHQAVVDLAANISGVMTAIGHKLGLYKAMAAAGPMTALELATKTGTHERYVREWLNNQAAGGYVHYDPARHTYILPDEHAMVLADPESPAFIPPAFEVAASLWLDEEKVLNAFRTGNGIGWHEHHHRLFFGTEAFFRSGYKANLTTNWIPALDGIDAKLKTGGKVADVGCGHGASTIVMAQAYPNSSFVGFDYHPESVQTARQRAKEAGLGDRVTFQIATAKNYPGADYDLICFMDCLHDMGDPVGAAKHAGQALAETGAVLLVEPFAGDDVENNLNPVGRLYYAASTAICTPNSRSQEVGLALGAQAGEGRLREIMRDAGFSRFRCAAETPFNLVLEARP